MSGKSKSKPKTKGEAIDSLPKKEREERNDRWGNPDNFTFNPVKKENPDG